MARSHCCRFERAAACQPERLRGCARDPDEDARRPSCETTLPPCSWPSAGSGGEVPGLQSVAMAIAMPCRRNDRWVADASRAGKTHRAATPQRCAHRAWPRCQARPQFQVIRGQRAKAAAMAAPCMFELLGVALRRPWGRGVENPLSLFERKPMCSQNASQNRPALPSPARAAYSRRSR